MAEADEKSGQKAAALEATERGLQFVDSDATISADRKDETKKMLNERLARLK